MIEKTANESEEKRSVSFVEQKVIDDILNNRPPVPTITTVVSNVDLGLGH